MRVLGIPSRVVTVFNAAHDTDRSLAIEEYYSSSGDKLNLSNDSVWLVSLALTKITLWLLFLEAIRMVWHGKYNSAHCFCMTLYYLYGHLTPEERRSQNFHGHNLRHCFILCFICLSIAFISFSASLYFCTTIWRQDVLVLRLLYYIYLIAELLIILEIQIIKFCCVTVQIVLWLVNWMRPMSGDYRQGVAAVPEPV